MTVPRKKGRTINVAFEDTRAAVRQDCLAQMVQDSMDSLTEIIHEQSTSNSAASYGEADDLNHSPKTLDPGNNTSAGPSETDAADVDFSINFSNVVPNVGDRVSVFWPLEDRFFIGTVHSEADDGRLNIHYDDRDKECLDMTTEKWNFTNAVSASSSVLSLGLHLTSTESEVLSSMVEKFGNKPFLKHHAQDFDQYPLINACKEEEGTFLKTVRPVPHNKIPPGSNIISSHTLYKLKQNDDGSLKLKARIAPHGNKDNMKYFLSKDCTTCPPTELRILESIASLYSWKVYKADVKAAFLQTGEAKRDVYVRPPKESLMKSTHLWLLLTAAYGLVNANA